MKCPACSNQLQQIEADGITVDVCKGGCGGLWFDNFEIKKFDEPHESAGQALLDIQRDQKITVDHTKRVKCPKCEDMIMMRHFFSVKRQVQVDECPGCGGFWLDAGELGKVRSLFNTEAERHQAADEYFNEVFGDKLKAMKAENEQMLKKSASIANIFRFICPTNYIPGDQSWGAF